MSTRADWQPAPEQWWSLGLVLVLGAGPHLLALPFWLTGAWILVVGWRLGLGLHGRPTPPRPLRLLVTAAVALGLFLHFGTVLGRDAGGAVLVMMAALKLLELRRRRDAILLILLGYLLLGTQFMAQQSVVQMVYAAVAVVIVTGVWIGLSNPLGRRGRIQDLKLAGGLLIQAVPVMLILFALFPRLPGPLWALPADAHSARTGLSDRMEPGRIGSLALSNAVAFRADFDGPVPPPEKRYWRGPVFEMTDGRRWWGDEDGARAAVAHAEIEPIRPAGAAYRYHVTWEPSGNAWLPALEMATAFPADAARLPSLELQAKRPVHRLRRDRFVSYPDARTAHSDAATLVRNLRLPDRLGERVRGLAAQWRAAARTQREIVDAALRHFNAHPFVYTLEPPLLGADPIDAFLFETRQGFCEHYAAAFTVLMRAAGIPARVVTGYQGGEINPLGGYLIVRQSDAHAWAEVWLGDAGWTRVDPTAAVAPERIQRRIDLGRAGAAVQFRLDDLGALGRALRRAQFGIDAMNNGWNQWVLGYGPTHQRRLLERLGIQDAGWREAVVAMSLGIAALSVVLGTALLRRPGPRDPVAALYGRYRRGLLRRGIEARPEDGPQALLGRVARRRPDLLPTARQVTELYIALRYAPNPDNRARLLRDLRRAVLRFGIGGRRGGDAAAVRGGTR